jgi:hypothetical protein
MFTSYIYHNNNNNNGGGGGGDHHHLFPADCSEYLGFYPVWG